MKTIDKKIVKTTTIQPNKHAVAGKNGKPSRMKSIKIRKPAPVIDYSLPLLKIDVSLPKEEECEKVVTKKISRLFSISSREIDMPNLVQLDAQGFVGWDSFKQFLVDNYDIGFINELYITRNKKLALDNISGKYEKIGYVIVTKNEIFKFIGGGKRITKIVLKKVREKVIEELEFKIV